MEVRQLLPTECILSGLGYPCKAGNGRGSPAGPGQPPGAFLTHTPALPSAGRLPSASSLPPASPAPTAASADSPAPSSAWWPVVMRTVKSNEGHQNQSSLPVFICIFSRYKAIGLAWLGVIRTLSHFWALSPGPGSLISCKGLWTRLRPTPHAPTGPCTRPHLTVT